MDLQSILDTMSRLPRGYHCIDNAAGEEPASSTEILDTMSRSA
jgi:hypothetical protein